MKIEVIEPHGLCAGVNAAIAKALRLKNVYCLHSLVHNEIVTNELKSLGYRFVETLDDIPSGETVVLSAHGVGPDVRAKALERGLKVVDTTCPFVSRVHDAAREFAKKGLQVVIIGDKNHVEVKGIVGEIDAIGGQAMVVRSVDDVDGIRFPCATNRIGVVSQTTMNADEVNGIVERLRDKIDVEPMSEVCNATKERQDAVRVFCRAGGNRAVLVLGSRMSANAKRLGEVAESMGVQSFVASTLEDLSRMRKSLLAFSVVGVTSGASTPERFFDEALRLLREVPLHVAIKHGEVPDGFEQASAQKLCRVLEWCGELGIGYLTVNVLPHKLDCCLQEVSSVISRNRVRFRVVGRRSDLSQSLLSKVESLERTTSSYERHLIIALGNCGRAEIIDAVNRIEGPVTEETFRQYLYAPDVPYPEIVIATDGEKRVGDFLLWASACGEYHFTDVRWLDFARDEFAAMIHDFALGKQRPGGTR